MAIRGYGTNRDVTAEVVLPGPLNELFQKVAPMGSIIERRKFFKEVIPKMIEYKVHVGPFEVSVYPAWTRYRASPRTHVYVIGHILLCHALANEVWYYQPSKRLFSEDVQTRLNKFKELLRDTARWHGTEIDPALVNELTAA